MPDAILDPPVSWYGAGFCGQSLEQQFEHFVYPDEGCSEIKLLLPLRRLLHGHHDATPRKWVRMYQSPKLEFVVNQDIWFNSETRMADIILPACTNFERDDIGEWAACGGYTDERAAAAATTASSCARRSASSRCGSPSPTTQIFADLPSGWA